MGRTRRHPVALDDDPRKPRKFRQKSGVNLIHEEPWFGFNVADKLPPRDDVDPAGNPFLGLPANRLKEFDITAAEQATNSTTTRVLASSPSTNADRAVDTDHIKDDAVKKRTIPVGEIDNDLLGATSVSTGKLQSKSATADKIASNAHGIDPLGNANQNDDPLRAISGDHVKTKTLEGFHLKDNSIGPRVLTGVGMNDIGGELPMGRTSGKLGAHRISGKIPKHNIGGVEWDRVDGKPPLATKHYVETTDADTRAWVRRNFQKKP